MYKTNALKPVFVLVYVLAYFASAPIEAQTNESSPEKYSVTWNSLGNNYRDSMPIGNGDIGLNLWTEQNGDVVFLIGKTDAWTENAQLIKLGRVRVKLNPNPFLAGSFQQRLEPILGQIDMVGAGGTLKLWVDANHPVIHLEFQGTAATSLEADVESWRETPRPVLPGGRELGGTGVFRELLGGSTDPRKPEHALMIDPDLFLPDVNNEVAWCHFNSRSPVYPNVFEVQHLGSLLSKYPDPLLHRCFGVLMRGPNLTSSGNRTLKSAIPDLKCSLNLYVLTEQPVSSPDQWRTDIASLARLTDEISLVNAYKAHLKWWSDFWNRSWIDVSGNADAENVTRGYAMQRWMVACGGRGSVPIKYNGSIFTVGQEPANPNDKNRLDPDYRSWGGNLWFQNTRLLYWPTIAAGDGDILAPFLRMYLNSLPLLKDRTRLYYQHDGAVWPETLFFWGLPNNNDFCFGKDHNDQNLIQNTWIRYHANGSIELVAIMLDQFLYTQNQQFAKTTLLPIADAVTTYFYQHWHRGPDGKLLLDPDNALETYQGGTVNPMPDIAGLKCILPELLALPSDITTPDQRSLWQRLMADLPALPIGTTDSKGMLPVPSSEQSPDGKPTLLPAQKYGRSSNVENPELYAIFPYRLYTFDKPGLEMAMTAYRAKAFKSSTCWGQDGLDAAVLGISNGAAHEVTANFTDYGNQHFKWFWKPGHDWIPDLDNGGAGMETLQLMLIQCEGRKITLLPAWPVTWSADFKIHGPFQTTLEGKIESGKVVSLKVTPESRRVDVVLDGLRLKPN